MSPEDEKRLFAASAVSIFLVILLCIFSFFAAESHAGLPEYDAEGLDDLVIMLDGGKWAVDADARALLEKYFGLQGVQEISTARAPFGLDIVLHTNRSPYVLGAGKGDVRLEGEFADLDFSAFLLYEKEEPVFCIFLYKEDILIEFPAL